MSRDSPALPVLPAFQSEQPARLAARSACILVTVIDNKMQGVAGAWGGGGGQGLQQAGVTPVSYGHEWQGVSWQENFLSLVICQGLAWDLFTYLISEERL